MRLPGDPTARNEEWARAHVAFHDSLIAACGNPRLLGICRRLSDAAELYRAWSGPALSRSTATLPANTRHSWTRPSPTTPT